MNHLKNPFQNPFPFSEIKVYVMKANTTKRKNSNESVKSVQKSIGKLADELNMDEEDVREALSMAENAWKDAKEEAKNKDETIITREMKTIAGKMAVPDLTAVEVLTLAILFKQIDVSAQRKGVKKEKNVGERQPQQKKQAPRRMYQ